MSEKETEKTTETEWKSSYFPVWKDGDNEIEKIMNLANYLTALDFIDSRKVTTPGLLIYSSLERSNKLELFFELPVGARDDLQQYKDFISQCYSLPLLERKNLVKEIKQKHGENMTHFLHRAITVYYYALDVPKKTIKEIKTNRQETIDIMSLFLEGIQSDSTKCMLKSQIDQLNLDNLASKASNIELAYAKRN